MNISIYKTIRIASLVVDVLLVSAIHRIGVKYNLTAIQAATLVTDAGKIKIILNDRLVDYLTKEEIDAIIQIEIERIEMNLIGSKSLQADLRCVREAAIMSRKCVIVNAMRKIRVKLLVQNNSLKAIKLFEARIATLIGVENSEAERTISF